MRDYRTLTTRFMFSRAPADPRPLNEDLSIHEAFGSWSFFWVYHHLNLITNIDHLTKDLRCHLWGLAWNINQFDADLWIFIAPLAFCARTRGAGSCLAQQKAPSAAAASAKWDFYWNDSSKSAARRDKMLGRWQQLPNVLRRRGGGASELRTEKELRQEARYQQWVSVCSTLMRGKITDGCFYCSCHTESGFMAHVISWASDPVRGPGQCMRPNTNKSTRMYVLANFWAVKDVIASLATKWSLCARNKRLTNNIRERSGILKRNNWPSHMTEIAARRWMEDKLWRILSVQIK